MAVGTVSGINEDSYQLIATNTTTSGTSTTFSGLGSYKKFILTWESVSYTSGATPMLLTFNSSTTGYYGRWYSIVAGALQINTAGVPMNYYSGISTNISGLLVIENTNNNAPKILRGNSTDGNPRDAEIQAAWYTPDTVTTIGITVPAAFSAGTFKLYGIAA